MAIFGTQALEQRDRLWEGLGTLNRPVGHIHRGLATPTYSGNITTALNKVQDQLVVTARGRVVNGVVTVDIADINLRTEFLDQEPYCCQPCVRDVPVCVGGKPLAITSARCRVDRVHRWGT